MSARLVVITAKAAAEIEQVAEWWNANRPAAPGAVREELARAFALVASQPRIGAVARNARLGGVRRVHLGRIRYHMYYRVTGRSVEVLALWHASRGSGPEL